jgi:hypothetical protein
MQMTSQSEPMDGKDQCRHLHSDKGWTDRQTDKHRQIDRLPRMTEPSQKGNLRATIDTVDSNIRKGCRPDCEQNDVDKPDPRQDCMEHQQRLDRQQTRTDSFGDKNHYYKSFSVSRVQHGSQGEAWLSWLCSGLL